MIKKTIIAILFFISFFSFSQTYEFAPVGAKWYFSVEDWDFWNEPIYYYSTVESIKDTIIDGKHCRKLSNDMIFYQNMGDSIFLHTSGTSFSLLYDFSAEVGETFYCEYCNTDVKVESVTLEYYFGSFRKMFEYTSIDNTQCNWDFDMVVEGVGSLVGLFYPNPALADWVPTYNLSCYKDPSSNFLTLDNTPCNIVGVKENEQQKFSIYPTLFNNEIYIENNSNKGSLQVLIFNSMGQIIYSSPLLEKTINTSNFSSGIYLVKIVDSNSNRILISTKVIKP
jgi:hypothetical protein